MKENKNLACSEMVHFGLEFCALLRHLIELSYYLCNLGIQKKKVWKEQGDFGLFQGFLTFKEQKNLLSRVSL